ncbi:MAG: hypothetical protein WC095_03195 [Candidatus Paceibacterota bacterium]
MTPEENALLKRTLSIAEENNEMLRAIRRSMRLARFMTIVYWLFIAGAFAGAYYLVQPYLETILNIYNSTKGGATGDVSGLIDFIKQN